MASPQQAAQHAKMIEEQKKKLDELQAAVETVQKQTSEAVTTVKRTLVTRKRGRDAEEDIELVFEDSARTLLLEHCNFNNNGRITGFKSEGLSVEKRLEILENVVFGRHEGWLKEIAQSM